MAALLISLPEELLERVIALAILPHSSSSPLPATFQANLPRSTSTPFPSRPFPPQTLLPRTTSLVNHSRAGRRVHRYTPLLVSRVFARIGAAVLYCRIHLSTPAQCAALCRTLSTRLDLALRVKSLRIEGTWAEFRGLIQHVNIPGCSLEAFDMTIAATQRHGLGDSSSATKAFCEGLTTLSTLGTVKSLTIRKAADAYLTLPGPASIMGCLSTVMERWQSLEIVHVGFRLPSGPRRTFSSPLLMNSTAEESPCMRFVASLSRAPSLRVVSAQLPAAWNSSLLEISSNPSLTAIRLEPSPPVAGPNHLFLVEASKYPRLDELIRAGSPPVPRVSALRKRSETVCTVKTTSSGRLRANTTLGTSSPPSSTVAFPSASPTSPVNGSSDTMTNPRSPVNDSAPDHTVQRQASRRKSSKGHTRQTSKWSRRLSVV
ncbi:hypothetical protein BC835DRAFT_1421301 [Cytidiella melzeri]|nr:hypothetical protein BC835DRAFT_1421301 [Cytidiella melzeri]